MLEEEEKRFACACMDIVHRPRASLSTPAATKARQQTGVSKCGWIYFQTENRTCSDSHWTLERTSACSVRQRYPRGLVFGQCLLSVDKHIRKHASIRLHITSARLAARPLAEKGYESNETSRIEMPHTAYHARREGYTFTTDSCSKKRQGCCLSPAVAVHGKSGSKSFTAILPPTQEILLHYQVADPVGDIFRSQCKKTQRTFIVKAYQSASPDARVVWRP
jgi:hypothetical protein